MIGVAEHLASRLRDGGGSLCVIVRMPCARDIEVAAAAGLDFAIVDGEHGPSDGLALDEHIRAGDAVGLPCLVRLSSAPTDTEILRALDAGAAGIVVPHVRDAEEARRVVQASHYPPSGTRGLAFSTRAARYGAIPAGDHLAASSGVCVVVQIEDRQGVEHAAEITAVAGVSAVLLGLTDLAADLGCLGREDDGELLRAASVVLAAAAEHGVPVIVPVSRAADIHKWRGRGATASMTVGPAALLRDLRSVVAGAAPRRFPTPLVLLPGVLCGPSYWDDVLPTLERHVGVQLVRTDTAPSVEALAEEVLAAAPAEFIAVGFSFGGMVAFEMLRRQPRRIAGLVVVNSSARPPRPEQLAQWAEMETDIGRGSFDDVAARFGRALFAPMPVDRQGSFDYHRPRMQDMAASVGASGFLRQLQAVRGRPDSRASLGDIACPTLVLASAGDVVNPPEVAQEIAAGINGAELVEIADCGHMSALERPWRVSSEIVEFVASLHNARPDAAPLAAGGAARE